ncbi:transducin/WD40 repeat-like superfamily protein [Actinidia rufa]|uniref:Transducin/WD40 repeat-like superfamily protein n=1 Tax=Actinidia rufa TaxID=165716 RepID=A0A7J0GEG3_9ERIC|nr:transducin/WD40 repeat-like superfamily protein [Actinidia rufa]
MSLRDESLELKEIERLEGHTDRVWGLAWIPAAAAPPMLASCGGDKTVRIWQRSSLSGSFVCKIIAGKGFFLFDFPLVLVPRNEIQLRKVSSMERIWRWKGRKGTAAGWDGDRWLKVVGEGGEVAAVEGEVRVRQSGGEGGLVVVARREVAVVA